MAAKKCNRCSLLSCFACFSDKKTAKPNSSEIAASSLNVVANASPAAALKVESSEIAPFALNVIGNASPAATLTVESSHVISSATAASPANASDDILGYDSQHRFPSVASSSQANASKDVLVHNDSLSVAPSAIPSSSQPTVTSFASPTSSQTIASPVAHPAHDNDFHVGSSSTPSSSSVAKESDHANKLREAAGAVDIENVSPAVVLTVESSLAISSSTIAAVPSSSQSTVTSVASPTSSHTIASPPAHPSHDKRIQVGSSSAPSSSSVTKDSDHTTNIREAVDAVDIENVDVDFSQLINYISELLAFFKEKKKGKNPSKPKAARYHWPGSKGCFKLRDVLSEGINVVKDVCPADTKEIVQGFLQGMGAAHMATTGLLVVANILERYEAISTNAEACLSLLKKMNILARHVTELQKRPELKGGMEDSIRKAIELIVEASIACCTQIDRKIFSKFFSTDVDGGKLDNFKTMLTETDTYMQKQMNLCIYDAIVRPRKERELLYPQKPKDAVGIEDPLKAIIERLEWGSDKNVLAVIVHGFGGMGKTTLADAVFARMFDANLEGCKYSFVRLFEDIATKPDIMELQKCILRDLKMGEEPEIRRYEEGQQQIEHMLEKEIAFIYIDNVLLPDKAEQGRHALEQLLPKDMRNAKKLRLLLTARDKDAVRISGVKPEFYPIEFLPEPFAVKLFKKTLDDNERQLKSSQMNQIVKICGGVPKLLTVVAGFISSEENPQNAYRTVMEESKKNWKGEIGKEIECYVFAYEKLDETLRDPFLDICSFFQGSDWEALSNIVGESELKRLERRAFVTKDVKSMTARVHDVILAIGLAKKGERFRFTRASEIQDFLDGKKDEDLEKIKGICSSDNRDPIYIPASKLDLMYRSLRVLILGNSTEVKGKCKEIFEELVIFSAGVSRIPFDASKLKKFEMLSHICCKLEDLENLSQMPSNLRHIEFEVKSHAFHISANCIQQLSDLQVLRLKNAHLNILPQEFGDLVNGLQELTLSNWEYLEKLPVSRLESFIRVLRVQSCSRLKQLPEDFGSLNSLQELDLSGCKSLEELPSSLENLTSLQKLDLTWCESLKKLPRNLGKLTLLQELHLYGCTRLEHLPSSLEELSSLRLLDLSYCKSIKHLPCGLGKLTSLVNLNLYLCVQLSSIPDSIGQLKLHSINLHSSNLKELPDEFCNLSILTELDMAFCNGLEKLPGRFGEVTSLRKLTLDFCHGLKKLPESFSQLKSLEHLDLSSSENLEELCIEFKGLSSLRVLSLADCNKLKKLPEDFHCVTSLEVLDLRNCRELEGKWMDSMVKMKTLQIVHIRGSTLLEERWGEIRGQCDQSFLSAVYTAQGLSTKANILKQLQSKFDSMITNGQGEPFHISGLPVNTLLLVLVMFDGQQEFSDRFPLSLIEENIDDIQTNFEIVYFGNHFDQLPRKVVNRILGHAPANWDAKVLFQKVLSLLHRDDVEWLFNNHFEMSAKIVSDEKGDKYLSSWEFLYDPRHVAEFVLKKCGSYLKLKQLIEKPRESNIELLRKLFAGGEEEISLGFLKNDASTKVGVDELEGKTILLDIRPANVCRDIPLQSLVDMYVAKERLDFEIITIPIMQAETNMDVSDKFSKEVPWLVLQNPWQLTKATKYFLDEGCPRDGWYPNKMRIIESNGTIAEYNYPGVLHMVNTWGAEAYPFTAEKWRELIEKEKKQMEDMSDLMFLFKHLESVSEQVKEATRQQKMVFLYSCPDGEFTNSIKDVLIELSNIIYIIYIPSFSFSDKGRVEFAAGIYQLFATLEPSKMSQGELQRMDFLSLSEHEAMRFWARIYSLNDEINQKDQFKLSEMLSNMTDVYRDDNYSWMFIMDEDGNVMTTEGKDIVKLLCKEDSDERVKELMQELIKGDKESWKKTLLEFEQLLYSDDEELCYDDVDSQKSLFEEDAPLNLGTLSSDNDDSRVSTP